MERRQIEVMNRDLVVQMLRRGRGIQLNIASGSMRPCFVPQRSVYVVPLIEAPRCGDVLAFVHGGLIKVHRLIAVERSRYLLKGDALDRADGWIARAQIVGVVTHIDGHDVTTPSWRWVNRQIAKMSPHSSLLWGPLRLAAKLRRRLGLRWL